MARYLFASHDGFGLGHVRRNTLVARSILAREPDAEITIVTGLPMRPAWLGDPRLRVVQVPAMLKDTTGAYRHESLSFEQAVEQRAEAFWAAARVEPPARRGVDRHPYGLAGELRDALDDAAWHGAALVLGLRDMLDQPSAVAEELAGDGWGGVADRFDEVLVYGERVLCDHEARVRPAGRPRATAAGSPSAARPATASPGSSSSPAAAAATARPCSGSAARWPNAADIGRVVVVAGPYAGSDVLDDLERPDRPDGRLQVVRDAPGCADAVRRRERSRADGRLQLDVRVARRRVCARCSCLGAARAASRRSARPGWPRSAWPTSWTRARRSTRWPGCSSATGCFRRARWRRPGSRLDGAERAARAVSELARGGGAAMKGPVAPDAAVRARRTGARWCSARS